MIVELTTAQLLEGGRIGVRRHALALARRSREPYGTPVDPWRDDIESALSELAASVLLGLDWNIADGPQAIDLFPDVEVRMTRRTPPELRMHQRDSSSSRYVLATGSGARYELHGWAYGWEGKRAEYWRATERPCFWVPVDRLRSMSELLDELAS